MNSPAYAVLKNPKDETYIIFKNRITQDTDRNYILW